jgi:hypothetical protein
MREKRRKEEEGEPTSGFFLVKFSQGRASTQKKSILVRKHAATI